jgi:cobalamin-dependent methionine synthase I
MVFHTIRIAPPRQKIYQRLGYHRQVTQISPQQQALTDHQIDEALSLIHLQGVARRVPIVDRQKGVIILKNQVRLESENLAAFLRECDEVLVMGATAGEEIMAAIRHDLATEAVTRAVVFDATASEMADGALEWLMDYTRQALLREGKILLDRRYSAGYGDFALENQQFFHTLLALELIGVRITEQSILIPEKSVTAVTGVRKSALAVEPHLGEV